MMAEPTVTVLLPVYNGAKYLRQAIDSVLGSSYTDFELLVIDDGSKDGSLEILRSYQDPRVRLVVHERNQGLITSLNEGLDSARGRYVARMDADDIMLPERLAMQVDALEAEPDLGVVATWVEFINSDGEVTGVWDTDRAITGEAAIRAMMPRTNCIAHPSVMMRRTSFDGLRYAADQPNAEDWDLWMRFLSNGGRIAKLPLVLLRYRVHPASIMAGQKVQVPLNTRLMSTRWRFLRKQPLFGLGRRSGREVWVAQFRTIASRLLREMVPALSRDLYRLLTYAPWKVVREHRLLQSALREWRGRHLFNFPYFGIGGAERVHADIVASMASEEPLVIISGFSDSDANRQAFERSARSIEIPRLLHHPFTRRKAHARIAAALNERDRPMLFASLSSVFFDLLPMLDLKVRTLYLQHAFLFQPNGNVQHKQWLRFFPRLESILFVSGAALKEYDRFLFANNVPTAGRSRLRLMWNAVHRYSDPVEHARIGVLFVGRDSEEKRLNLFLEVARHVLSAAPDRFRFTVVGPLARQVEGIRYTGPITDPERMSAINGEHDVVVITSHREGFPMVVMEAMAHGLAVLSTPVGDIPDRLSSDVAHITTTIEQGAVVAEMTQWLLGVAQDTARLQRMRKAAFDQAHREFSMDAFVARYRALLTSPDAST